MQHNHLMMHLVPVVDIMAVLMLLKILSILVVDHHIYLGIWDVLLII